MLKCIFNAILKRKFYSPYFWEKRYQNGGNSGEGSYGILAEFKAKVINTFIEDNDIGAIAEFGCGDGNQMRLFQVKEYTGYDISYKAIELCKQYNLLNHSFYHLNDYKKEKYELVLSLDVIYHLIEDDIFEKYMKTIFSASDKFICIYSTNYEKTTAIHVRHRKFTDFILKNFPEWTLIKFIENEYKEKTECDFYFFQKNNGEKKCVQK